MTEPTQINLNDLDQEELDALADVLADLNDRGLLPETITRIDTKRWIASIGDCC